MAIIEDGTVYKLPSHVKNLVPQLLTDSAFGAFMYNVTYCEALRDENNIWGAYNDASLQAFIPYIGMTSQAFSELLQKAGLVTFAWEVRPWTDKLYVGRFTDFGRKIAVLASI